MVKKPGCSPVSYGGYTFGSTQVVHSCTKSMCMLKMHGHALKHMDANCDAWTCTLMHGYTLTTCYCEVIADKCMHAIVYDHDAIAEFYVSAYIYDEIGNNFCR